MIVAVGVFPSAAGANAPVTSFSVTPSTTQAGGHPNLDTLFTVGDRETQNIPRPNCDCEDAKNVRIDYPPGLIGNPHVTPQCGAAEFANIECPVDTQIGIAKIGIGREVPDQSGEPPSFLRPLGYLGVYNLVPHPGQAGLLGFNVGVLQTAVFIVISPRTESDYGLKSEIDGIEHLLPLSYSELTLWGVPAASSHDGERIGPVGCGLEGHPSCTVPNSSNLTPEPFLDNPTSCGTPLSSSIEIESYDLGTSVAESSFPSTTGCDQLSFNPSLFAQPTTGATDSPSGLAVNLQVPQESSPSAPSPSEIKETTLTLPPGFSINPNAADGKSVCTEAQARFGTEEEAQCPEDSKVGTLTIESSALPGPLPGYVYLGQPRPGNRYRIFLVANGFDVHVKIAGSITANAQTGQLVASFNGSPPSFEGLPQSPFSSFNIHFFGSDRGLLATPVRCGTYPVESIFTPWDSFLPKQTSTQYFELTSGPVTNATGPQGAPCPGPTRPFNPSFEASTVSSNVPGAHAPFFIALSRSDGDQDLSGTTVTTPPGLSATLAGVGYCTDQEITSAGEAGHSGSEELANPSCPPSSQIGTATVGAGAGDHPVYVPGRVYLAGPYQGAPLSLAVITPAISGPYDLGNVVVRAALHVNPETAQITAVSDPLPRILEGIPLRLRSILLELNRPNFTLNPTNCDPLSVEASVTGEEGARVSRKSPFQVSDCTTLPFAPKLTMDVTGSTKRAASPALKAAITYPKGSIAANIARAAVTLPPTELVDNAHIKDPCTRVQFAEGRVPGEKCPPGSEIGFAKAETPLLEKPIEGPVYLRSSGRKLPDVVATLNGQIDITLDGHIDTVEERVHGEKVFRIRTSFETIPDAPVSNFTLSLDGGAKGLLENNTNLCTHPLHVTADIAGQNGKSANQKPVLATPCNKKRKRKTHRAGAGQVKPGGGR